MKNYDTFKTRQSVEASRQSIAEFFGNQNIIYASVNGEDFPIMDSMDYFYFQDTHFVLISPKSKLSKVVEDGSQVSAFIQEGFGKGAKKFYGLVTCTVADEKQPLVQKFIADNPMIAKILAHKGKIFTLTFDKASIVLGHAQIYNIDTQLNPTFADVAPNGKARFAHSRQVLMTYLDRKVIFSVVVEDGVYYCLAKVDSFKMEHIKNGGLCKIYDGEDNHFETVIQLVPEKTDEIFQKLMETNNAYFKENQGLVALRFTK